MGAEYRSNSTKGQITMITNEIEYVLCVPERFVPAEYLTVGLHEVPPDLFWGDVLCGRGGEFVARDEAEQDPSRKQIIPYILFLDESTGRYFSYRRSKQVGEQRLAKKRSLGIGGHINQYDMCYEDCDVECFVDCYPCYVGSVDMIESIDRGLDRELEEEVNYDFSGGCEITELGVLHDHSNEVGRVHVGVVMIYHIYNSEEFSLRDENLIEPEWLSVEQLVKDRDSYESWSQIVIDHLSSQS